MTSVAKLMGIVDTLNFGNRYHYWILLHIPKLIQVASFTYKRATVYNFFGYSYLSPVFSIPHAMHRIHNLSLAPLKLIHTPCNAVCELALHFGIAIECNLILHTVKIIFMLKSTADHN